MKHRVGMVNDDEDDEEEKQKSVRRRAKKIDSDTEDEMEEEELTGLAAKSKFHQPQIHSKNSQEISQLIRCCCFLQWLGNPS